jgi:protoporphyrin/coproporphyrin ferrochelatase
MAQDKKRFKTGVLLVNLGTPDSPNTKDVRPYLRQFLMDRRVIDIPFLSRWALINLIIAPFRAPKSAHEYKKLWTERGSPLFFHGKDITVLLQEALGPDYIVSLAMRYKNPSVAVGLEAFKNKGIDKLIVVPLFPQYASASTGSAVEEVMMEVCKWEIIPEIHTVGHFCQHPLFIESVAQVGEKYLKERNWDHIIFSYHGIPERHIMKGSCNNHCKLGDCCNAFHQYNQYCYRAQCFETTRLLVAKMGLPEGSYSTSFQSRLGKTPWIKPYTDMNIKALAEAGKKSILFFSPSFVADCLETTIEGGEEYKELFEEHGGEHWQLVESLNTHPTWVACLKDLVIQK